MGLMDKFSDPSLFDSLSFGDKMAGSAITMLMGMGITFCGRDKGQCHALGSSTGSSEDR